ncbi:MAG: hypothetical protein L6R37_005696 [Teloschistes peruensis]|nr:MAG: hypothetical protein L6R37_005696 [Teloschistes peruensis]
MNKVRQALQGRRPVSPSYEPLDADADGHHDDELDDTDSHRPASSWVEYCIFLLLGVAMLWAWNMFLAASPYFQHRFSSSSYLLAHFPSYITSVSTITNVVSMAILTHLQRSASYPRRIVAALCLNIVSFTLLAISTTFFRSISPQAYFGFLMLMVFMASLSAGLCQNGIFAYVSGFKVPEYTQGIMTGQAVAGVLPCIAQIISVLSVSESEAPGSGPAQESSKSAFVYFLTATVISAITLLAFLYLVRHHNLKTTRFPPNKPPSTPPPITTTATEPSAEEEENPDPQPGQRKPIPLLTLFLKLRYLSLAVFTCFLITMFFPIYTQSILSTHTPTPTPISTTSPSTTSRLLQPACFIPLAFLFWNTGDLTGRLLTGLPLFARIMRYPRTLLALAVARVGFVPLYMLCNIRGGGAVVRSDLFYLVGVQFLFGLSNGWIGSVCMMGAGEGVEEGEKEAAGGFMGMCLVAGLGVGSLLSFLAA